MWLTRVLGGSGVDPKEVVDELNLTVAELKDAIAELRSTTQWMEDRRDTS